MKINWSSLGAGLVGVLTQVMNVIDPTKLNQKGATAITIVSLLVSALGGKAVRSTSERVGDPPQR